MVATRVKWAMRIRPANAGDVPAVLPMVRALCDLHEQHDPVRFQVRPDVLERYAKWLPERAADGRSVFLVAEREGAIGAGEGAAKEGTARSGANTTEAAAAGGQGLVGFLVGTIEPEVPIFWLPECGWVHDVWVDPAARGAGIGRGLVHAAAARFAALGVKQVRLHTGVFNEAARKVFAGTGFRPCVVEMLRETGPEVTISG